MKVLFMICYASLDSEITSSVSRQLLSRKPECEVVALLLRPEDFDHDSHALREKLIQANVSLVSVRDWPNGSPVRILRDIGPDLLITTDDVSPLQHKYMIASRFLGITSLLVQPGIFNEVPTTATSYLDMAIYGFTRPAHIFRDYMEIYKVLGETRHSIPRRVLYIISDLYARFKRKKTTNVHGACSRIAVSGDFSKELLIRQGVPVDRIVVTGLPRLDSMYNRAQEKDVFIKHLELQKDRKVVLFLPDASDLHKFISTGAYWEMIYNTISSCSQLPGVQLVVKPHPYEDFEIYRSILKEVNCDALIYEGADLHGVIRASDAVITGISTTGLETLILGKPLIILRIKSRHFPSHWEYIPYISGGVAFGVDNIEDLSRTIITFLNDDREKEKLHSNRAQFLHDHLYLQDGKASERVADLILEMCKL